jgi:hypothetical protein
MNANDECLICYSSFRDADHQPRILTACGHTICKYCVWKTQKVSFVHDGVLMGQLQVTNMLPENLPQKMDYKAIVKCPLCKKETVKSIKRGKDDFWDQFPVNYALMGLIDSVQNHKNAISDCPDHRMPANILCFDNYCPKRRFSCFECLKHQHSQCEAKYSVDSNSFLEKMHFDDYDISLKSIEHELRKIKLEFMQKFDTVLSEQIEKFKTEIGKVFLVINKNDISSLERNLNHLHARFGFIDQKNKLYVCPRNKSGIDKLKNQSSFKDVLNGEDFFGGISKNLERRFGLILENINKDTMNISDIY